MKKKYFGTVVHASVKNAVKDNNDEDIDIMLRSAEDDLSKADFSNDGSFVCCFSEVEDDLGQWRGYGRGECGYAIGFDSKLILKLIKTRLSTLFVPINYESDKHKFLADDIVNVAKAFYKEKILTVSDKKLFTQEFFSTLSEELEIFSSIFKHPKFENEKEWRITTYLSEADIKNLEFAQRHTLLARHLPVDLNLNHKLPITRIYVGPSAAQGVSKISVGDLLKKYGYSDPQIPVELSKVPYRTP